MTKKNIKKVNNGLQAQIDEANKGIHNSDLAKSSQRILEGGSWKKQRIIMLIPAGKTIPTKVYLSHCSLIFPPNQSAHRMAAVGMEVGEAFSNSIEEILQHPELSQWEYLITVEHDNCPPQDGVIKLIKRIEENPQFSAISGLYWTKGNEGVPQIWGDINDPIPNYRPQPPRAGELIECYGIGMGFAIWRLSMFKDPKLRRPFFKTVADLTGVGTQDLHFASDARKYGYRFGVDCNVLVGHFDFEGKFGQPEMMY